jgi:hypothetical protein
MIKEIKMERPSKSIAESDKLALNLFLSLSMQVVIKQRYREDEGLLSKWAEDQIAQSAQYIFPVPFEA